MQLECIYFPVYDFQVQRITSTWIEWEPRGILYKQQISISNGAQFISESDLLALSAFTCIFQQRSEI